MITDSNQGCASVVAAGPMTWGTDFEPEEA